MSISSKTKRSYYGNLDLKDITGDKKLQGTVKPLFSNKMESTEYATLEENGKIISNDKEVARIINKCFLNNHDFLINAEYLDDPIDKVIIKYNRHPSILIFEKFTQKFLILLFLFNMILRKKILK